MNDAFRRFVPDTEPTKNKDREREKIAADVAQFLESGGKIVFEEIRPVPKYRRRTRQEVIRQLTGRKIRLDS